MLLPAAVPQPAPPLHLLLWAREWHAAAGCAWHAVLHSWMRLVVQAACSCLPLFLAPLQACHCSLSFPQQVAVFYVNKLRVAGIQGEPLNPHFEQVFEVGVDEVRTHSWLMQLVHLLAVWTLEQHALLGLN